MTNYQQRFDSLLTYIEEHLDLQLTVEHLSEIACFSPFHFHRLFSSYLGKPLKLYIQERRLYRAAYQLSFRQQLTISEIAYQCAFNNSESFSRAFKKAYLQSPREYRKAPKIKPWLDKKLTEYIQGPNNMNHKERSLSDVTITEFESKQVATLRHHGCPSGIMNTVQQFITWRKNHHLPPSKSATYNVIYSDPTQTAPDEFIFDICTPFNGDLAENEQGVFLQTISGGTYAQCLHIGSDKLLEQSFNWLYGQWLPQSGKSLRDRPTIIQRLKMFPDVPEHQSELMIYLPIEG